MSLNKEVETTEHVLLLDSEADEMIACILIDKMKVDEMVGKWLTDDNQEQWGEMN